MPGGKKSRKTGRCGRKGNVVAWNAYRIAGRSSRMYGANAEMINNGKEMLAG